MRFLIEKADRIALAHGQLAVKVLVDTGDDPQKGGFPRSVQAEDADFGPVIESEGDVLEDLPLRGKNAADPAHGKNNVCIGWHGEIVL
jgi:hypothetical protein